MYDNYGFYERQPNPPFGPPFGSQFTPPFGPPFGQPSGPPFGPPFGPPQGGGFPPGQAGPPSGPPPSFVPSQAQLQAQAGIFAVDPGAIRPCIFRFVFIRLDNGRSFWAWLVFVGRRSVAGWRWNGFRWVYFGIDLDRIESFVCF